MRPVERNLYAPVRVVLDRRQKDLADAVKRRNPERYKRDIKSKKLK